MKTPKGLSFGKIVLAALLAEVLLIGVQIVALQVYLTNVDGTSFRFDDTYMQSTGFYVFMVAGFYVYAVMAYNILPRVKEHIVQKLMLFVVVGGSVEVAFYLLVQASYQGVFVYSILEKVIATASALILFNIATNHVRHPNAYF